MKDNYLSVSTLPDKHLSADVMYQYLENQLTVAERHEVELHLLNCVLCTDALTGYGLSSKAKSKRQLFEINYHLKSRSSQRHPNHILQHLKNWGITTAVFFIVILAALLVWFQVKQVHKATPPPPTTVAEYSPAQPVSGQSGYHQYLQRNLRYPDQARQFGISGTIEVSFLVKPDSTISDLQIIKGITPELNQEAIRLIKEGPAWIPARRGQNNVAESITIRIPFRLTD